MHGNLLVPHDPHHKVVPEFGNQAIDVPAPVSVSLSPCLPPKNCWISGSGFPRLHADTMIRHVGSVPLTSDAE